MKETQEVMKMIQAVLKEKEWKQKHMKFTYLMPEKRIAFNFRTEGDTSIFIKWEKRVEFQEIDTLRYHLYEYIDYVFAPPEIAYEFVSEYCTRLDLASIVSAVPYPMQKWKKYATRGRALIK